MKQKCILGIVYPRGSFNEEKEASGTANYIYNLAVEAKIPKDMVKMDHIDRIRFD